MYNIEEVKASALDYFKGDELAANVWVNKYALKDSNGNYYERTPDDMHMRLAKEFARIEAKYPNPMSEEDIFKLLEGFKFIVPQGSPMSGIGNDFQVVSISNCFVVGNEYDSYGGIMHTDQEQVQLMKRRGGVGHDLSHIRPSGSTVLNSAITSSGVASFMERFSNSTREVGQDGRRGALMLSISIKHPDSESFIDAKLEQGKVTGANISVKIDDEFMQAVITDGDYIQTFPVGIEDITVEGCDYDVLYDIGQGRYIRKIKAKRLWNKITKNSWKSAEPGILFWDTITNESPARGYGEEWKETSTNPCGEIPLNPYDSCRLLAINLFSYVDKPFTKHAKFNTTLFKSHVEAAQRLSDDIVDLEIEKIDKILAKINNDPEPEHIKRIEIDLWNKIKNNAINGRRTGTGITGVGDMLAALGLTYGSDEAIEKMVMIQKMLAESAYLSSIDMAVERGAFPIWDNIKDTESAFLNRIAEANDYILTNMDQYGRRNIAMLTIAPTGSTSLLTQTTSGIEPCFAPYYKRRRKINPNEVDAKIDFTDDLGDSWTEYTVFHHNFLVWAKTNGYIGDEKVSYDDEKLEELVSKSPYFKATANDVDWVAKVKMQGAMQKWVDHSISVTVNLPSSVAESTVGEINLAAYESGCKGITVYRDGSRSGVLITNKKTDKRPKELPCDIHHVQAGGEKYYVLVGLLDDKPYEIFAFKKKHIQIPQIRKDGLLVKVKSGSYNLKYNGTVLENITQHFEYPDEDGFTRLLSLLLRRGISIEDIVDQVNKSDSFIGGFYKAITRVLSKNYMEAHDLEGETCPDCGGTLRMEEGCVKCTCGHSKCG